jgi:predicted NUDIX family phosphoesterase
MDKQIVVVPRDDLFRECRFEGFLPAGEYDFEARVRRYLRYASRAAAETDPSLKQPIAYCLIVNPTRKLVFAYRRASESRNYQEARLQGKWSWGVGGHIEKYDLADDPIRASMLRELSEEVTVPGEVEVDVVGYINDDSNPVGQVHFGILYKVATEATDVIPNSPEMAWGGLVQLSRLEEILSSPECEVETWSRIATTFVSALRSVRQRR